MLFGKIDPVLAKLRGIEGERYLPMRAGLVYVLFREGVERLFRGIPFGRWGFLACRVSGNEICHAKYTKCTHRFYIWGGRVKMRDFICDPPLKQTVKPHLRNT